MNTEHPCVLGVVGTTGSDSISHIVLRQALDRLKHLGADVDLFDPAIEPLALFDPATSRKAPGFPALKARVDRADALIVAMPDYHGSIPGTAKNFLDHFWQEFTGRLLTPIVVSHEKGLTVIDQFRTVARQCYAWTLPYGVSVDAKADVSDGKVATDTLAARLDMLAHDIRTYALLLRRQRLNDLAGTTPGFLSKLRPATQRSGVKDSSRSS